MPTFTHIFSPFHAVTLAGACTRHYHPTLSIWLSVDPMADKYPSTSPYAYCADNPVRLVDEDGREVDEWNFNIVTGECKWVSNKGGKMVDYINVHDGKGLLLGTATMGNNTNTKIAAWTAQDFGFVKNYGLYLSDGANKYEFFHTENLATTLNLNQLAEIPHANYVQDNTLASDISFGTAIEGGMVSEAARLSGETSFLKAMTKGGTILGALGGAYSTWVSINYAKQNPSVGNYTRVIVQGATTILGCIPGWGTVASIGLTAFDYYFGDTFYNWIDQW